MKNDPVPVSDHISRYCRGGSLDSNDQPTGASFQLGDKDEYLSVNWLELLQLPDRDAEISEVRRVLATKLGVGGSAKLAVLNVGGVQAYVRERSEYQLRILHRPDEPPEFPDLSHSGIFDTELDEMRIAQLIAQKVLETHSAK